MVKKSLYIAWAFMLLLCGLLGFVVVQGGPAYAVMIFLAVLCFIPPVIIVVLSVRQGSAPDLRRVRNVSALSLGMTLVLLLGNFLTVAAPEWVGNLLYGALVVFSSPMICGQIWILSLLLWAALLWSCLVLQRKIK